MSRARTLYSRQEKIRLAKEAISSGMVIGRWCDLNNIARSTMYGWLRGFKREEPDIFDGPTTTGEWIEISRRSIKDQNLLALRSDVSPVDQEISPRPSAPELSCVKAQIGDVVLSIPSGTREADLKAIFRAARQ